MCYCASTNPLLYYKMMTPQWLQRFASLSQVSAATPESLHFKMNQLDARIIKVNLFSSGELPCDDIAVTITLHLEDPPTSDSDFLIGICDDTVCNGLWITDSGNYPNAACQYATMNSGTTYTNNHNSPTCGAPITYEHYIPKHCHTYILPFKHVGLLQHPT